MKASSDIPLALLILAMFATLASCQIVGGWTRLTDAQFNAVVADPNFQPIMQAAQNYAYATIKCKYFRLGTLKYIDYQIVSGINYQLTYKNKWGEITQIVVYYQPWTNTIIVLSLTRTNTLSETDLALLSAI